MCWMERARRKFDLIDGERERHEPYLVNAEHFKLMHLGQTLRKTDSTET